jgi:hypothetical protein
VGGRVGKRKFQSFRVSKFEGNPGRFADLKNAALKPALKSFDRLWVSTLKL